MRSGKNTSPRAVISQPMDPRADRGRQRRQLRGWWAGESWTVRSTQPNEIRPARKLVPGRRRTGWQNLSAKTRVHFMPGDSRRQQMIVIKLAGEPGQPLH
jgi:hypothetical protein